MGTDKLWTKLGDRPLIASTLEAVATAAVFDTVVVAADEGRWPEISGVAAEVGLSQRLRLCTGGAHRQDSVRAALSQVGGAAVICVHDAARPLCPPTLFRAVVAAARLHGAATAGIPCVDSIKQVAGEIVVRSLDRTTLVAIQTPQAFVGELLREAHALSIRADDDCALVEQLGHRVHVVPGHSHNVKATSPVDLILLRALYEARSAENTF